MSIANEISRLNTAKANIKAAIETKGVVVPSATTLDGYPSIIANIPTFDPYAGHDYVEIGGLKWATMNIGANSVTDYGLYFQWGDTTGYLSSQCGSSGTTYAKPFNWSDYKFSGGRTSPGATGMTKYNASDRKTVLDICDDAARAAWGGQWRIPTAEEYIALCNAANTAWTADYRGSGVSGMIYTDKTDSSKVLFFPAAGAGANGSVSSVGWSGNYWSSSLDRSNIQRAYYLYFYSSRGDWQYISFDRYFGLPIRGVVG